MNSYRAPVRDLRFALHDLVGFEAHAAKLPGGENFNRELVDAVLDEAARFAEQVLAPLNMSADAEGCTHDKDSGAVRTPQGFREAYAQFVEGGWSGLTAPEEFGGQGLPELVGAA